jgi:hypothetical protein
MNHKQTYQKNMKYQREHKWRLRGINLTWEQYQEMLKAQGGCCAICRKPPVSKALHADHNHETGYVRGLLCFTCNRFLTDAKLLEDALAYVQSEQVMRRV